MKVVFYLPMNVAFQGRLPSIKVYLPIKFVLHQRSSSLKVVFHQWSSSIEGQLLNSSNKVVFNQRQFSFKGQGHPPSSSVYMSNRLKPSSGVWQFYGISSNLCTLNFRVTVLPISKPFRGLHSYKELERSPQSRATRTNSIPATVVSL